MGSTTTALLLFVATYVAVAVPKLRILNLDRPTAAFGGAMLMVVTGVLTLDEAYRAVNCDTLLLLFGMMVVIAYLRLARFFEFASAWVLRRAGTPRRMLIGLVFASGMLSALSVNDTICLLFTPILLGVLLRARLDPVPYLIALVTSANIGSAMMLTGNPQNMLIGISSGIPFGTFLLVMMPAALVCLALNCLLLLRLYRSALPAQFAAPPPSLPRVHRVVVLRMVVVVFAMIGGFLLPLELWIPGLSSGQKLPLVAALGALAAALVGRYEPRQALAYVDWSLLVFFAGLFIVIGGVAKAGILAQVHAWVAPWFGTAPLQQSAVLTVFSVAASQVVSNVPYVLIARDWIPGFADPKLMWYVLSLASTFAGNLTIVGSVANLIVLEQSKDTVDLGFLTYLRAGVPITVVTTLAGVLVLWAAWWAGCTG